jgi:hypothetical protein
MDEETHMNPEKPGSDPTITTSKFYIGSY